MTTVINIRILSARDQFLVKRHRLPGYRYIGRSSNNLIGLYGNQYTHLPHLHVASLIHVATREDAVRLHKEWALSTPGFVDSVRKELKDKILVCWCKPAVCHGDTLAAIADGLIGNYHP